MPDSFPKRSKVNTIAACLVLALTIVFSLQCGQSQKAPQPAAKSSHELGWVTVSGMQFLNSSGKPLLLHGINVSNKSPKGYVGKLSPADFTRIRSWGMNCIRLIIVWGGLEPQPGHIDEAYLDRVAKVVGWAKAAGLYVLLDMHQDLYSVKFSDGAPAWATLDEGKPNITGSAWSDAYFISPAVQTALDHFWANSPGPDGVGLQDHYAQVWQKVAERFRNEPAVVGYDLMNEPFPGHDAARMSQAMMRRLSELLAARLGSKAPTPKALLAMKRTSKGKQQILEWLKDKKLYTAMVDAAGPIQENFERTRLFPFYSRVAEAIRKVDTRHILFVEPAMSTNTGIPTAFRPLTDASGKRDPEQVFAPHEYDLVTDTIFTNLLSNERVAIILAREEAVTKRFQIPMFVGEWGAYYGQAAAVPAAQFNIKEFEKLDCGDAYWSYSRKLANSPLLPVLESRMHTSAR